MDDEPEPESDDGTVTCDLVFEDVTPRQFLLMATTFQDTHKEIHVAEMIGAAGEEDVEAIHSILEAMDGAPEELFEATDELAEELAAEYSLDIEDGDEPAHVAGSLEDLEDSIAGALGAEDVDVVAPSDIEFEGGDDDSDGDRMFQ